MIVAIMEDSQFLGDAGSMAKGLRERGHKVVRYGEYSGHIDAIVYEGAGGLARTSVTAENVAGGRAGVLMVNSRGKSIEEIDRVLNAGVYSPLGLV